MPTLLLVVTVRQTICWLLPPDDDDDDDADQAAEIHSDRDNFQIQALSQGGPEWSDNPPPLGAKRSLPPTVRAQTS